MYLVNINIIINRVVIQISFNRFKACLRTNAKSGIVVSVDMISLSTRNKNMVY